MDPLLDMDDRLDSRQFQLAVKRLADSLNFGSDVSPFFGAGIDYAQSRPYQAGDPVKSIDWRVTGRTGRVHVKEYEAPKRLPVYVLVDTSASMCVSSAPKSKYAWAAHIAGGLALAALARLSPVGIIGCGERPLGVRASLSRTQIFIWLDILRRHRFNESTLLGKRLRELAGTVEERSLVLVLSDLHDPDAIPALKRMAQDHDCVALQLQDAAEREVTGAGIFRGAEAETGRTFAARGRRVWLDQGRVTSELRQAGVDHLCLPTDADFVHRLRTFLRHRDQLGRGSR